MTKMIRRRMAMAGTLVAPMLARHGWAQSAYPNKQIRMVVPFAPAGGTDDRVQPRTVSAPGEDSHFHCADRKEVGSRATMSPRRSGGIGRRAGLKIR